MENFHGGLGRVASLQIFEKNKKKQDETITKASLKLQNFLSSSSVFSYFLKKLHFFLLFFSLLAHKLSVLCTFSDEYVSRRVADCHILFSPQVES